VSACLWNMFFVSLFLDNRRFILKSLWVLLQITLLDWVPFRSNLLIVSFPLLQILVFIGWFLYILNCFDIMLILNFLWFLSNNRRRLSWTFRGFHLKLVLCLNWFIDLRNHFIYNEAIFPFNNHIFLRPLLVCLISYFSIHYWWSSTSSNITWSYTSWTVNIIIYIFIVCFKFFIVRTAWMWR